MTRVLTAFALFVSLVVPLPAQTPIAGTIAAPAKNERLITLSDRDAARLKALEVLYGDSVVLELVVNWITERTATVRADDARALVEELDQPDSEVAEQIRTALADAKRARQAREEKAAEEAAKKKPVQ